MVIPIRLLVMVSKKMSLTQNQCMFNEASMSPKFKVNVTKFCICREKLINIFKHTQLDTSILLTVS